MSIEILHVLHKTVFWTDIQSTWWSVLCIHLIERNNHIFLHRGLICHVTTEEVNCKREHAFCVTVVSHTFTGTVTRSSGRVWTYPIAFWAASHATGPFSAILLLSHKSRMTSVWQPSCRSSAKERTVWLRHTSSGYINSTLTCSCSHTWWKDCLLNVSV